MVSGLRTERENRTYPTIAGSDPSEKMVNVYIAFSLLLITTRSLSCSEKAPDNQQFQVP